MTPLKVWITRALSLFRRDRLDRELTDELDSHVQLHIDDNLRLGMSADEARRQALLKLGGVDQVTETYRGRRGLPLPGLPEFDGKSCGLGFCAGGTGDARWFGQGLGQGLGQVFGRAAALWRLRRDNQQ